MENVLFYLKSLCPNCGGTITDKRLKMGSVCENCLQKELRLDFYNLCGVLEDNNSLKLLKSFCEVSNQVRYFEEIFKNTLGVKPSSLQISWAKRYYLGESFAIIAPTGTGKSSFGLLMSILSKKSLIILPTKLLVEQFHEKVLSFLEKNKNIKRNVLAYTGSNKDKKLFESNDFDILICTIAFFHKHTDKLKDFGFDFIFIDDVDSFLKSGKNVENLFYLLGFSKEDIDFALKNDKTKDYYDKLLSLRQKAKAKLIVSSATLKPKTNRAILFNNLLGFEIARFVSTLRNIKDVYIESDKDFYKMINEAIDIVKHLKDGGIVFIEENFGKEYVDIALDLFKQHGIRASSYLELKEEELLDKLKNKEIDVAIGLSHLSNPLLRGLDLPYVIRYVIFIGVPKIKFKINTLKDSPSFLSGVLNAIMPLLDEDEKIKAASFLNYLKKFLNLSEEKVKDYPYLYEKILKIKEFLSSKLENEEFKSKLLKAQDVFLEIENNELYIVIGNPQVYLQGSGRASRLTLEGLLPGLSIIVSDSMKALNSLIKRLNFYVEDISFEMVDINRIVELDKSIKTQREQMKGSKIDFKTKLIIVESPHKAKTIASFFGKPSVRKLQNSIVYEISAENSILSITASLGHIFNLSRKEGIYGVIEKDGYFYPVFDSIKIDRQNNKQYVDEDNIPQYVFDKRIIIDDLRRLSFYSDEVYIASDPDTEGEKIAYDIFTSLRPFKENIKRLEFHEITKQAFKQALANPRDMDINRVKAQISRRVADRWVGFSLSKELWRVFKKHTLSAGRVQTPVLGWVIDRTQKSRDYKYTLYIYEDGFKLSVDIEDKNIAKKLDRVNILKAFKIKEEQAELSPAPPYTTDTILQDAYIHFRFDSSYVMKLLQELFEIGLITYHRTDSTRVSDIGRYAVAKPYILEHLGEEYFYPREFYQEGAHECIRPTRPWDAEEVRLRTYYNLLSFENPKDSFKLYDLIFKRFMASQTRKAVVLKSTYKLDMEIYSWEEEFITDIIQDGFDRFYKNFDIVRLQENIFIKSKKLIKTPKTPLFTQGTLIKHMKERGLGRPSTYAEIVSTLLERKYIYELKNGYLISTKLGREVYEYLSSKFYEYVSEEFTAKIEEFMDRVENHQEDYQTIFKKLLPLVMIVEHSSG